MILANIYNITWKGEGANKYKFFHNFNSIIVPPLKNTTNPWRYPFADILMYTTDAKYDVLSPIGDWRKWMPGVGFDPKYKWPNGTNLVRFGGFKMRVAIENRKYMEKYFSMNWTRLSVVGVTNWYNHYYVYRSKTVAFLIPDTLYYPARPFIVNDNSSNSKCKEIVGSR